MFEPALPKDLYTIIMDMFKFQLWAYVAMVQQPQIVRIFNKLDSCFKENKIFRKSHNLNFQKFLEKITISRYHSRYPPLVFSKHRKQGGVIWSKTYWSLNKIYSNTANVSAVKNILNIWKLEFWRIPENKNSLGLCEVASVSRKSNFFL